METSGKPTDLWVNNIDVDILVRPQAEHLRHCLVHTDRFCQGTRKDSREVNVTNRCQVVYRYKTNLTNSQTIMITHFRLKSQVCINHTHVTQTKADLELTAHFLLKF